MSDVDQERQVKQLKGNLLKFQIVSFFMAPLQGLAIYEYIKISNNAPSLVLNSAIAAAGLAAVCFALISFIFFRQMKIRTQLKALGAEA